MLTGHRFLNAPIFIEVWCHIYNGDPVSSRSSHLGREMRHYNSSRSLVPSTLLSHCTKLQFWCFIFSKCWHVWYTNIFRKGNTYMFVSSTLSHILSADENILSLCLTSPLFRGLRLSWIAHMFECKRWGLLQRESRDTLWQQHVSASCSTQPTMQSIHNYNMLKSNYRKYFLHYHSRTTIL